MESIRLLLILFCYISFDLTDGNDMSNEIVEFCTCWTSYYECNDGVLKYTIDISKCPKMFRWERVNRTRTTTSLKISIGNITNHILCDRREAVCSQQAITSNPGNLDQYGIKASIVPVCEFGCSCNPRESQIICHVSGGGSKGDIQENHSIILAIALPLILIVCIALSIIAMRRYARRSNGSRQHAQYLLEELDTTRSNATMASSDQIFEINFN